MRGQEAELFLLGLLSLIDASLDRPMPEIITQLAVSEEIKLALELWDVDGLTTNPKHVQAAGKPFREAILEIAELFAGTEKPVSVEGPHRFMKTMPVRVVNVLP